MFGMQRELSMLVLICVGVAGAPLAVAHECPNIHVQDWKRDDLGEHAHNPSDCERVDNNTYNRQLDEVMKFLEQKDFNAAVQSIDKLQRLDRIIQEFRLGH